MQRAISSAIISAASSAMFGCAVGNEDGDDTAPVAVTSATATTTAPPTTDGESSEGGESSESGDGDDVPPLECMPPLVACGGACVDLASDPNNCGQCGVSCVLNNANPSCVAGACAMDTCAPGFADCNANPADGCEHTIDCQAGGSCTTSCNSDGVVGCGNPCAATCDVPAESCNAKDDDCNGACDEGPIGGCRIPIHRAYGNIGHFYSTSAAEISAAGLSMEGENYFYVYPVAQDGLIPLNRCIKPNSGGRRFLSFTADCEGLGAPEVELGFMSPDDRCGATPLWRLYAPAIDSHFYTTSEVEADNAVANFGYGDKVVQGYIFGAP